MFIATSKVYICTYKLNGGSKQNKWMQYECLVGEFLQKHRADCFIFQYVKKMQWEHFCSENVSVFEPCQKYRLDTNLFCIFNVCLVL